MGVIKITNNNEKLHHLYCLNQNAAVEPNQNKEVQLKNDLPLFLSSLLPAETVENIRTFHRASKRGGNLLKKRTRKYTGCHINLGLGHNCDYRELIGAAQESQHWDAVG